MSAVERLPERLKWMAAFLGRAERLAGLSGPGRALDIGAAQGLNVAALARAGWEAVGIEPSRDAIAASGVVAEAAGVSVGIIEGVAEKLPFQDGEFDLVLAQSVMEHVLDVEVVFREVARVLRPGGVFFFHTTNALSPRQSEIAGFPLFPWYPNPIKSRIMHWAVKKSPERVGHTLAPALHWFTPWGTRRRLRRAGFRQVFDHWDMKRIDSIYLSRWKRQVVSVIASTAPLRIVGDVGIKASAYMAIKEPVPSLRVHRADATCVRDGGAGQRRLGRKLPSD